MNPNRDHQHQRVLSGAQERKKKAQALAASERLTKITTFLSSSNTCASPSESQMSEDEPASAAQAVQTSQSFDNEDISCNNDPVVQQAVASDVVGDSSFDRDLVDECGVGHFADAIIKHKNPTDKGHFKDVNVLSADEKRFIITSGSCRPAGPYPPDKETGARFSSYYYETTNKSGVKMPRSWLCYSEILDCAYCEPCWLFAERNNPHFQPTWVDGVRTWRRIGDKIKEHESSGIHHNSCVSYELWRLNKTVDKVREAQLLKEKSFWCEVLDRIMNITLTLATCNLPFRGHREVIGGEGSQHGNFLSIVELLAKYDPVLKELISKPAGSVRYLSPKIQNELINLLSKTVEDKIVSDIKEAPFFSVIMDTTQDISKVDQLSQVFRYVKIEKDENDKPTEIKIQESFLGFKKVDDQTAAGLEAEIIDSIKNRGIQLSKCRGQGYDGAAVMSGAYTGVQRRILDKEENALYVHCSAHNLNLVLNDAVNGIQEVTKFFNSVERIYVFFANSIKRWALLSTFFDSCAKKPNMKLKRLCPTRWSSRNESLLAIRFRYRHIMQALSKITIISKLSSEREEACFLMKELETFEFVFQVVLHSKILMSIPVLFQLIYKK